MARWSPGYCETQGAATRAAQCGQVAVVRVPAR